MKESVFSYAPRSMPLIALLLAVASLFHCAKGEPSLDEDNVILTITASPSTILNFGDTSVITVQAVKQDGRPVLDGARIQFAATGGSIAPEATTQDGRAVVVFTSDATIGSFTITASSGIIGADGSVAVTIEVVDRIIEISSANLSLNPSNVPRNGGQVEASLVVLGPAGEPLPNKAAVFSTSFGRLASNGSTLFTNEVGQVRDVLFLGPIPEDITNVDVTARVGTLSETQPVTVTSNVTPTPVIQISPQAPIEGETVFFSGTGSTDPDGTILDYEWDFGDGTFAAGATAEHRYERSGTFVVSLRVRDNQGAAASLSQTLTVGANQPPVAEFTFSPSNPRVGDIVFFDATGSRDPDGSIESYSWSLGNGITRSGPTISFAYPGAAEYTVVLTVTDNGGAKASSNQTISVAGNQLPEAAFTFTPTSPRTGERVVFDATSSTDADGSIESYVWNFGDNDPSVSGPTAGHSYIRPGTYQVLLTVTDNDGGQSFATNTITISDFTAPTASFTFSPTNPRIGDAVRFDASGSSAPDGSIVAYTWDFGDGGAGTGESVQHSYLVSRSFLVTLTVRDSNGKTDSTSREVTVGTGGIPVPSLRLDPTSLPAPGGTVLLDATESTDQEDGLSDLRFDFTALPPEGRDIDLPGGRSPLRQMTVADAVLGDRIPVTVTVTDTDGNEASTTQILTITDTQENQAPVADLTAEPNELRVPGGTVILDGRGSSDPDHAFEELEFDFGVQNVGNVEAELEGDGPLRTALVSNGQVGDTVTFRLTVTDPVGAQNTAFQILTVTESPSNTAPIARLSSLPSGEITAPPSPTDPVTVTLSAIDSSDAEQQTADLSFTFRGSSTRQGTEFTFDQQGNPSPFIAVATIVGVEAGDQITLIVRVVDEGGLSDEAALLLPVVP
ncbi:PKD domain-containing protein [Sulfidibacter corallicola]|uniref:PKD domain-containing protein n=1 Tax=Sulfidibacter corallicola TaxID=2818388 RepID=A0A8A4TMQ3_SULCO|nr:PKD domain-containing protein [Sulfidibacter corallicola]QTD50188.1 PKD domain-containing protein [Sulfidibacter corallicola]